MTSMPTGRYYHSCGLITKLDQGPEIVVAGGFDVGYGYTDTVDIYTIVTDSWREGDLTITP